LKLWNGERRPKELDISRRHESSTSLHEQYISTSEEPLANNHYPVAKQSSRTQHANLDDTRTMKHFSCRWANTPNPPSQDNWQRRMKVEVRGPKQLTLAGPRAFNLQRMNTTQSRLHAPRMLASFLQGESCELRYRILLDGALGVQWRPKTATSAKFEGFQNGSWPETISFPLPRILDQSYATLLTERVHWGNQTLQIMPGN
jgi:hypothetical protein